jgi:hypothetical protein
LNLAASVLRGANTDPEAGNITVPLDDKYVLYVDAFCKQDTEPVDDDFWEIPAARARDVFRGKARQALKKAPHSFWESCFSQESESAVATDDAPAGNKILLEGACDDKGQYASDDEFDEGELISASRAAAVFKGIKRAKKKKDSTDLH